MGTSQEEIEEVRVYDVAKSSTDEAIPFEQAIAEIEHEPDYND